MHIPHRYCGISRFYTISGGATHGSGESLTIQSWPEPHNIREVQSFLGFANFYRRFISHYAELTQPLTILCQKNTPWHFGETESAAFRHLKMAFRSAPVLYHWALDLPMMLETDTSV